eukprot:365588-Chlamydomonas_euryale.AAC.8
MLTPLLVNVSVFGPSALPMTAPPSRDGTTGGGGRAFVWWRKAERSKLRKVRTEKMRRRDYDGVEGIVCTWEEDVLQEKQGSSKSGKERRGGWGA